MCVRACVFPCMHLGAWFGLFIDTYTRLESHLSMSVPPILIPPHVNTLLVTQATHTHAHTYTQTHTHAHTHTAVIGEVMPRSSFKHCYRKCNYSSMTLIWSL